MPFPKGFPAGSDGKVPARNVGPWFDPRDGKIPWRRKWQPTPVFLPGESHGQRAWQATVHRVSMSWTQLKQLNTYTQPSMALLLQLSSTCFHSVLK